MSTLELAKEQLQNIFPERLAYLVKSSGLSLQQIADGVGVTKQHIIRLKNGKSLPSAILVLALARFFEVDPSYFYSPIDIPGEVLEGLRANPR
jgi:transcriptional regulator with XRE-family HTH domain